MTALKLAREVIAGTEPRFIDTARPKEHEADYTKTSCSTAEKRGSRGRVERSSRLRDA
jgi:hypothetical protein